MAALVQIVVFGIGKELYGLGIDAVHEIIKVPEITAVPNSPAFLEGMIDLRGKILPVIDLRKRLRLADAARGRQTRVLITESAGRAVGLLVDSVSEVLKVPTEALEPPPEMITSVGVEYITKVAKVAGRLIILLDLPRVLRVDTFAASVPAAAA